MNMTPCSKCINYKHPNFERFTDELVDWLLDVRESKTSKIIVNLNSLELGSCRMCKWENSYNAARLCILLYKLKVLKP